MFISKRDLDNLENKLREEFNGKILELRKEIICTDSAPSKPIQTKKKAVK